MVFMCPHLRSLATVLWMPPGADTFACRQRWGRQVAYASQFMDRIARGHQGAATIKSRLCSVGGFDPDEWDLPPKPKWMRWRTYNRMVERFDRYEVSRLGVGSADSAVLLRARSALHVAFGKSFL